LDCVIYVYKDADSARAGIRSGGSGFLVAFPYKDNPTHGTIYAVTNRHVFDNCGISPAIRLNTTKGETDVLVTSKENWKTHADGSDVAVCPIEVSATEHRWLCITPDFFVTKRHVEHGVVSPGHETFMVGRFVTVQGEQRNTPALRFGNIAMLPWEPITDDRGLKQESFLIECRSIPGYSGSPVFVYDPHLYRRGLVRQTSYEVRVSEGPWLLGINWAHISNYEPIFDIERQGPTVNRTKRDDLEALSNTSMAAVIPAWILLDLLLEEEFVMQREKADKEISNQKAQSPAITEL
jgi:hypothetical protein